MIFGAEFWRIQLRNCEKKLWDLRYITCEHAGRSPARRDRVGCKEWQATELHGRLHFDD